ncbi:antirestriction protein ArdA [Oscillibacter ruminantium]
MDDCAFEAFVTNLGKYNEGQLVGEWVKFPTTAEEMQEVFKRIGINAEYEEIFITDYDVDSPRLYEKLGEYENLDTLNYLASRIQELSASEREQYDAILESGASFPGDREVEGYINLTYNLDKFDILPDVHDESDLGNYWVNESGAYDTKSMGTLANYIDYEAFGRDIQLDEGGYFSDAGYIRDTGEDWELEFDGSLDSIPEEYRLSGVEPELEITQDTLIKAMEAAGYHYDELESTEGQLRFIGREGNVMKMDSWRDTAAWLNGVVFEDPEQSGSVESILHPEHMATESGKEPEIAVLVVEPMKEPYVKNISSELESLQHEVSGDIEVVYPFADPVGLICNDEGKLNGMELNRAMRMEDGQIYDIMAGKFLVVGLTEDSFRSLTEDEISKFTALYRQPEIFAQLNGEIVAIPVEPRVEPERSAENTYELFQLKDAPETREYRFESMEHLKRRGLELNPDLYEKVYAGNLGVSDTLDSIYERFNLQHPDDFRGHPLSVSDVIVLHENGKDTAHFVDSFGFTEIPEFLNHDMALVDEKTSGLAVEGHMGTWHTIDQVQVDGKDYFLMEHDTYGDEAAGVIVDENGKLMAEDIFNGFDEEALEAIREVVAEQAAEVTTPDIPMDAGAKDQKQRNHLAKVEEMVEDDYGMIDGIINNGSKATEEDRATDKKPSVMEKLQEKKAAVQEADRTTPEIKSKAKEPDLS